MLLQNVSKNVGPTRLQLSRILIIEDDLAISELLDMYFKMNGYYCRIENNATDILGLIDECKPDLVIVDYLLPGVNGGELCAQIKRSLQWSHIPVVIFSAYPKVMLSLGTYGCDAFVAKPFDLEELKAEVEALLVSHGMAQHQRIG